METGQIDSDELHARIVSLFKKGNHTLPENYRPISLLNTIYKLKAAFLKNPN